MEQNLKWPTDGSLRPRSGKPCSWCRQACRRCGWCGQPARGQHQCHCTGLDNLQTTAFSAQILDLRWRVKATQAKPTNLFARQHGYRGLRQDEDTRIGRVNLVRLAHADRYTLLGFPGHGIPSEPPRPRGQRTRLGRRSRAVFLGLRSRAPGHAPGRWRRGPMRIALLSVHPKTDPAEAVHPLIAETFCTWATR